MSDWRKWNLHKCVIWLLFAPSSDRNNTTTVTVKQTYWNGYLDVDHAERQQGQKYDYVPMAAHLLAILIWYSTLKKA